MNGTKTMTSVSGMMNYAQAPRTAAAPTYTARTTANGGVYQTQTSQARPVSNTTPVSAPQTATPAYTSGIQKPRQPESTVKPVEINIPDFLKNSSSASLI